MSNFLENIEIKNFKSIRHQKIEGCKKINVFIGYPNVGKSNILEALSFLSYLGAGNAKLEDICRVQEYSELFFDGNIQDIIEVKYSKSRILNFEYHSKNEIEILNDVLFSDSTALESTKNEYDSDGEIPERRIIIKKGKQAEIIENKSFSHYFSVGEESVLFVKKYDFIKNIEKNQTGYHSLFFPIGQNLFYIIERNAQLRKELVDVLGDYNLKLFFDKGDNYTMKAMKTLSDDTVFTIPFHQIADTLQRLFFYKAAIQTNKDSVLLFEEPEAHMFPPYIKKFTSDIVFDNSNQFFIATHSPYVLNALIEEAKEDVAIYLIDYKNGETIIKNLKDQDIEEIRDYGVDLFFNIENYLKNGK